MTCLYKLAFVVLLASVIISCGRKNNVIQGQVTYVDEVSKNEAASDSTDVYLYLSKTDYQQQPNSWQKKTATGADGYYSIFPLANGPYYVYCKKLDKNGAIVYGGGASVSVSGSETKILNIIIF